MAVRRRDHVVLAVAVIAALALVVRLAFLDHRGAHWDEARVAWWTLRYLDTGSWQYEPILHGPFLFHVNRWVFELLGPSDFTARLVVAVGGALLPLAALPFRGRLRDDETIALALLLAADPLLLYYSRFMRNDLLLAGVMLAALGLLLRSVDTGRRRYVFLAVPLVALGFTMKGNAILYLLCWAGAAGLVALYARRADAPLDDYRGHAETAVDVARELTLTAGRTLRQHPGTAALAGLQFLVVVVWFYAPRGEEGATLNNALAAPSLWPSVILEATVGSAGRLVETWVIGGGQGGLYPVALLMLVVLTLIPSLAVVALAGYGVHWEQTRPELPRPRPLVSFAVAWAGLSLLGYPLAVDLVAGWRPIHVVVPLTIPAAVGLATLARRARPVLADRVGGSSLGGPDRRTAGRAVLALAVVFAHVLIVGAATSFVFPGHQENVVGQPAHPDNELAGTAEVAVAVAQANDGLDVVYYGAYWREGLYTQFPLAWYFSAGNYEAGDDGEIRTQVRTDTAVLEEDPPPVVVVLSYQADAVEPSLDGYVCSAHELDQWVARQPGGFATQTYIYIDEEAMANAGYGSTLSSQACG